MKNIRFLVLGGLLVAGLAAVVAGLYASGDDAVTGQSVWNKFADEEPVITRVSAGQAFFAEQGPEVRSMKFLDGRGSHLGVMVQDSDAGVRIDEVHHDSAAEKAGLRAGDIVTEFDGERVRSARQFTRLVQETPDGKTVRIAVLRNGQKQTVDATPESATFGWDMKLDGMTRKLKEQADALQGLKLMEPRGFAFRYEDMFPDRVRGRLGVTVESLTPQLQEYFGARDGGALVATVTAGSAAEKAGLKAGDVITTVNGARVTSARDVTNEINQAGTGELTIGIVRDRKASTIKATIEPRTPPRTSPRQPASYVLRPA